MRLISFSSQLSIHEIEERLNAYVEFEKHHPLSIFGDYTSTRTGLHTYIKKSGESYDSSLLL